MMQERQYRQPSDAGQDGTSAWMLAACLLLFLVLAACQSMAQPVSHDRLVRFFDDLVFGTDYALDGQRPETIRKLTESVHVRITGKYSEKHHAEVKAQLERFSKLTRTPIQLVKPLGAEFDYEIRFVPSKDFLVNREYVPCYASIKRKNDVVERVRIVISTENPALVKPCIAHEIMHSFGFGKHSPVISSILSPLHAVEELTPWDEMALRTLYDTRLKPGMTRKRAMPIAAEVLREVMAAHRIARQNTE